MGLLARRGVGCTSYMDKSYRHDLSTSGVCLSWQREILADQTFCDEVTHSMIDTIASLRTVDCASFDHTNYDTIAYGPSASYT